MKSIKSIINQIIIENDMEDEFIFARIGDIWKNQFHFNMQANIHLHKYKNKILYFKTNSPAWKQEISMQLDTIINKFNIYLAENLIEKINIK